MEGKKNIGIWIRVSTDMQVQDESPEHHEKRARMYAEAKGWNVITIYRLDALSGKSVLDYTETKRMLKDIQSGTISGIVFSRLSRLARNTKELLEISEIFRQYNADLISLAEAIDTSSPAGRLFFTIIAAMATWEREEISERVAASVPIRAQMGKPLGGAAPYGYKWEGKELFIDEAEAPVRKLMYEIFLKTKRKKSTAEELNNLGHRTRNGSKFSDTTVDRLLKDPTAKGLRIANYTKSLGEGKNWVLKPEADWIKLPCPAVVSEEIWNDCNTILAEQHKKRNVGPRTVHLLAGYVYCSSCNNKMYVFTESPVYKCKKCKTKIAVADIDEIYHEQLKAFLITDVDMDTYNLRSQTSISEKEDLLKIKKTEFQKLKKKSEEIINLRIENEISKEDFQSIYRPLEEQLRQIENQIPELEAEIDFLKIQFLNYDTIQQDAKDLYSNWVSLPYEERRSVIETITDRLVVGTDSIDIKLAYQPIPSLTNSLNGGNRQRNNMDSSKQST